MKKFFVFLIVICSSVVNAQEELVSNDTVLVVEQDSVIGESKLFKTNAHASYYSDKLNGRKTASGQVFNNSKYTAAHKKLKFGTKVKVTNTVNGKWVIVTINDRGPFTKGREIDLTKKAFMEIAKNKNRGELIVNLEIIE